MGMQDAEEPTALAGDMIVDDPYTRTQFRLQTIYAP